MRSKEPGELAGRRIELAFLILFLVGYDHQVAPLSSLETMPTTAKKAGVPAKKGVSGWIFIGLLIEHAIRAKLA